MRPGLSGSGRRRSWWVLVVSCLLCSGVASGHELFSWWRRELLEISLEPGDWVRIESQEWLEGRAVRDTIDCSVLESDGSRRWVEIERRGSVDVWIVELDLEELGRDHALLDAVRALWRSDGAGGWRAESLRDIEGSAIARGRLEDPFEDPRIVRTAWADSVVQGRVVSREHVELREERTRVIPQGSRELRYRIELRSDAVLSPEIPIFGLLRSETVITESTEIVDGDGRRVGPPALPQQNARALRCLDSGHGEGRGLPGIPR